VRKNTLQYYVGEHIGNQRKMKRNPPFGPSSQNLKGIKARHLECTLGASIGCMKFLFSKEFVTVLNRSEKCEGPSGGITKSVRPGRAGCATEKAEALFLN
jgi:hypothetical protein